MKRDMIEVVIVEIMSSNNPTEEEHKSSRQVRWGPIKGYYFTDHRVQCYPYGSDHKMLTIEELIRTIIAEEESEKERKKNE
jgi:hypothetical protein